MWFFGLGNKYKKLKREDVVNSIVDLETRYADIEKSIDARCQTIADLMEKGKTEKNREIKLLDAKRIITLREENEAVTKRGMYILYNIKLLNRLKDTIDEDNFVKVTSKVGLGELLSDQKGLAKFLNKALKTKTKMEEVLTGSDDLFNEVKAGYTENPAIYGAGENEDALLAVFETGADDLSMLDGGKKDASAAAEAKKPEKAES